MKKLRKQVYEIIDVADSKGSPSYFFDTFLIILILANVVALILESVKSIQQEYFWFFKRFELYSVIFFSAEYLFRVWTVVENSKFKHPLWGRLKWMATPIALIDLAAILPFYLPLLGIDLRALRLLRIFRLFRLFKLVRYVRALILLNRVVREKKEELLITIIFTLFLLLMVSSIMYYVEYPAQPQVFSSIPATMWWGIATLTTVGYGDIYPVTSLGKFLGGVIAILGIGLFALPTGILASGFSEALSEERDGPRACPHCGNDVKCSELVPHPPEKEST